MKKVHTPKVGLHISEEIREALDARISPTRGPSATVAAAVARYHYLCQRTPHGFSEVEIALFVKALNGLELSTPQIAVLGGVIRHMAEEQDVALGPTVIAKLATIETVAERVSLADAIERKRR